MIKGKTPADLYQKRAAMRKLIAQQLSDFFTDPYYLDEEGSDAYSLGDFNDFMYDEYGDDFDNDEEVENIYRDFFTKNNYDYNKIPVSITPSQLGIGDKWAKFMKKGYYDKHPGDKYRLNGAQKKP